MTVEFTLPAALEAHVPPEARGLGRDGVRLLVSSSEGVEHHRFTDLPSQLRAGDVLVVNTSATVPAAVPVPDSGLVAHISTEQPDGRWLVELRQATGPFRDGTAGTRYPLFGGGSVTLRRPFSAGRLWESDVDTDGLGVLAYLAAFGSPIRYSYVGDAWPISCYQTVFGVTPGSAEMPSASRPFTERLVTRLVARGVQFAPVLLHTGVASPEAHERPYPERFAVPRTSRDVVARARAEGRRVIAVGTTAVRAIESDADGGWTDVIITPERGVRHVDGLLTGFHEPMASHLDMLAAIAGPGLLNETYRQAIEGGYLWHEFGDVNLLLP
ncbi:S-adenosylmethionine:tRNA ribosyltransferase-isomerase [Actinophytocola oryzae]|uniref:S-adenosylmethionine:tRNA ribosyltransferase-isomerase n=1 Tax=Actinophytocola oryzae TaxID=502181 RepID=A0A4V3FU66_9PSEU|nr:S-adenosylmethionine:tRNA ribosyltransferase-isomerase [Actinophytocola oryzae]TDV54091.1 S-adenosylmethionine:tRNA ribosyltransferase-isomerase [Actinophytocola oryzae]